MDYKRNDEKSFQDFWKKNMAKVKSGRIITEADRPIFNQIRSLRVLQALAMSEADNALVVLKENEANPRNYCTPDNGYIHASFGRKDPEKYKKMVIMHESGHLTVTPITNELPSEDSHFVREHKQLVNILEDVRVNRYLCLKYPGITRYFDSELSDSDNPFLNLCLGDLIGEKDLTDMDVSFLPFLKYQDEIRACVTFDDILAVARKIVDFLQLPPEEQKGEAGDGQGDGDQCDVDFEPGDGDEAPEGSKQVTEEDIKNYLRKLNQEDSKAARLFDSEEEQVHERTRSDDEGELKITKKDKEMFLGQGDEYETFSLSKHLIKMMQKEFTGWRSTREGRLDKINLTKLYTDNKVFKRRNVKKTPPKAYVVLDGSGSMWGASRSWQKSLATSLTKLFKQVGIDCRIFIHSGTTGEFLYSEIKATDIPQTGSYCYTLDGSMLQALFEYEIPYNQKALVFYFSDGGIAAQYRSIQVPLLEKYTQMAEKRGAPVFGIGIETADVDVFRHWYVLQNPRDLPLVLERIGNLVSKYLR